MQQCKDRNSLFEGVSKMPFLKGNYLKALSNFRLLYPGIVCMPGDHNIEDAITNEAQCRNGEQ